MKATDLFDQSTRSFERLGLRASPFTESPPDLESETLDRIFTGRTKELSKVFNLFQSRERRRILISGRIGIGKTIFMREVLLTVQQKRPQMLTTYISLPKTLDLATTALIALAQKMPDDEWAQQQLYQMGIPTEKLLKARSANIGGNFIGIGGKIQEDDLPFTQPQYPEISLDILLRRALKVYSDGVMIAIDDLDKQAPKQVQDLLFEAQGMLKGRAWYLLTRHPIGVTQNWLTMERGLFDLHLQFDNLDQETTYQMLINYLNSVRIDNDCTDRQNPRCVLPFTPTAAKRFCEVSLGKPRLFNRLGTIILDSTIEQEANIIDDTVLAHGLAAAAQSLEERASLNWQETRVRDLIHRLGSISDETITLEDLESINFSSFSELISILEKLENADLIHQLPPDQGRAYAPIPLSRPDP